MSCLSVDETYVNSLPVVVVKAKDDQSSLAINTAFQVFRQDLDGKVSTTIDLTQYPEYLDTAQKMVNILEVLKLRKKSMISSNARMFIFDNLQTICKICNDNICDFCKTLVTVVAEILIVLRKLGDDGFYEWIPTNLLQNLFFFLKRSAPDEAYDDLSPQFFKFVYMKAPVIFNPNPSSVGGYTVGISSHSGFDSYFKRRRFSRTP
jgi:hypothetical protein